MAKSSKTASASSLVDHDLILELTRLLDQTGLTEIEIEQDGKRVRVARGAGIWFIVFIASMMSSVSPAFSCEPISTKALAPGSAAP